MNPIIYFDHNATAPILPEAKLIVQELLSMPLNASSVHWLGRRAKYYKEEAKNQILDLFCLSKNDYQVIFTSTGTEANNLIIKNFYSDNIIISPIEHLSVYKHKDYASNVFLVEIDSCGLIDLTHLELLLKNSQGRTLVSIMIANNETGIIQPMLDILNLAKKYGAFIHTDACQAIGKMSTDFSTLNFDFITISGHKIGAGLGAAALIMKKHHHLLAQNIGGGQEYGIRSGSENIPAIVAFGVAAKLIQEKHDYKNIAKLRNFLEEAILAFAPDVNVIGLNQKRLSNTSAISMPKTAAIKQMIHFDTKGFAISLGSACSSGSTKTSHVLKAMELPLEDAENTIRVSLGLNNNMQEILSFVDAWKELYSTSKNLR